jgi:hypothetical protein
MEEYGQVEDEYIGALAEELTSLAALSAWSRINR